MWSRFITTKCYGSITTGARSTPEPDEGRCSSRGSRKSAAEHNEKFGTFLAYSILGMDQVES